MNKAKLLEHIAKDRGKLEALVESLGDAQLDAPGPEGNWAVRDHLAHLAAWERMAAAHLADGSDHEVAGMDESSFAQTSTNKLNDRLHKLYGNRTLDETRREFAAAHAALIECIEAMPEARLEEPYWDDDPSGRTVLTKLSGDSYLHYREHTQWIREQVRQKKAR
jgi:hypothetical protein